MNFELKFDLKIKSEQTNGIGTKLLQVIEFYLWGLTNWPIALNHLKRKKKSSVFILRLNQYWFSDCTVEKEHMETSNKLQ